LKTNLTKRKKTKRQLTQMILSLNVRSMISLLTGANVSNIQMHKKTNCIFDMADMFVVLLFSLKNNQHFLSISIK